MMCIPIITRKILLPTNCWMKYSLNEVQTKIKDKNKCRALRAVPFHPFSCCLIFYLSLCVFPDVLNRSGEDCLMRKQTFASARLFRDSRSWKWNWSDLKRVEKAIAKHVLLLTCNIERRYSKYLKFVWVRHEPPTQ